jgi:hypothetical protein
MGVAVWKGKSLYRAFLARNTEKTARGLGAWLAMAHVINSKLPEATHDVLIVSEIPQVYKGSGVAEDLIELAGIVGACSGIFAGTEGCSYVPKEWKGQTPKAIHNKRVMAKLGTEETRAIEKTPPALLHNVIDAIGIGLFYLRR